jgi:hypothetical protein
MTNSNYAKNIIYTTSDVDKADNNKADNNKDFCIKNL